MLAKKHSFDRFEKNLHIQPKRDVFSVIYVITQFHSTINAISEIGLIIPRNTRFNTQNNAFCICISLQPI